MTVSLKYHDGAAWSAGKEFRALKFIQIPYVARLQGTDLHGIEFSHRRYSKTVYELIIGADELYIPVNFTWIMNFYQGVRWKFSTDNWVSETEVVLSNAEEMPQELINGSKQLPKVTFKLIQKYPNG